MTSGMFESFVECLEHGVDDGLRHAFRGEQHQSECRVESGVSAVGHGRHLGQQRRALCTGDRQRHQFAGARLGQHGRAGEKAAGDLAAHHVLLGGRRALVRNMSHVDGGDALEEFGGEMAR